MIALLSLVPFILSLFDDNMVYMAMLMVCAVLLAILIVPFFLMYNGIVMMKKEGKHISHLLSLFFGIAILAGEIATVMLVLKLGLSGDDRPLASPFTIAVAFVSMTMIYISVSFLVFMLYTIFLQIVPIKKDFDYVIILGAGLLHGDQLSKLLKDRLDKAIEIYRKDPTPPVMVPSGGQGSDETIAEAGAMKKYLLEKGIPEKDIMPEMRSTSTFENLKFSKELIDARGGRKYTALVTSNYHVYRALRYSKKNALACTGVGSRVAFYYWPSALIREYIAIHSEKKHALIFICGWLLNAALLIYFIT
ncbi:MAG: YdcF family protein [Lachnospiraceae bacterium]|nr:YdcF family protein [Lachnospiraceae bacterium]